MKTADDMIARYKKDPTDKTLENLITVILGEILVVMDKNKSETIDDVNEILDEQDKKWRIFAAAFPDISSYGFEETIKTYFPMFYENWKEKHETYTEEPA